MTTAVFAPDPLRRLPSRGTDIAWYYDGQFMGYLSLEAIYDRLDRQRAPFKTVEDVEGDLWTFGWLSYGLDKYVSPRRG